MQPREIRFDGPLDLVATLRPLVAGPGDPTQRLSGHALVRATRTPEGPASLLVEQVAPDRLRAQAWGPGAPWALDRVGDLTGIRDDLRALPDALFESHPVVRQLARRARGVRLPRTRRLVELLVLVVLQQKVSGKESARAYRNLVHAGSEVAPGPVADLWLPLGAETLRAFSPARLPPLGVLPRQGRTLRELGLRAQRIEEADTMPPEDARRRLLAIPGLGPWSTASALLHGMGDADAVPLGDWNLPSLVAFSLTGEERADDARMLELLEPFRGQRGRVIRWLYAAGRRPPRRGPRLPLRPLPSDRDARPL